MRQAPQPTSSLHPRLGEAVPHRPARPLLLVRRQVELALQVPQVVRVALHLVALHLVALLPGRLGLWRAWRLQLWW